MSITSIKRDFGMIIVFWYFFLYLISYTDLDEGMLAEVFKYKKMIQIIQYMEEKVSVGFVVRFAGFTGCVTLYCWNVTYG